MSSEMLDRLTPGDRAFVEALVAFNTQLLTENKELKFKLRRRPTPTRASGPGSRPSPRCSPAGAGSAGGPSQP
jgi:hypothetical protein